MKTEKEKDPKDCQRHLPELLEPQLQMLLLELILITMEWRVLHLRTKEPHLRNNIFQNNLCFEAAEFSGKWVRVRAS